MNRTFSFASREATFAPARRVHQALTAGLERRLLVWIASRLPGWVSSDQLTVLALGAQVAAGIGYAVSGRWRPALLLVNVCLVLNWIGDSLDGTLARVRNQQRPRYGFYVDHVVDLFGAVALMGGMCCSGLVHWPVGGAMLVGFLLLAAESYLATYTIGKFQLSQGPFGPTEIRILLVLGNLALLRSSWAHVFGHRLLLFDIGGGIGAAFMWATAVIVAARHTAQLYREEPLP